MHGFHQGKQMPNYGGLRRKDGHSNILNSPGVRGLLRTWVVMILQNSLGCLTSEQMGLEAATKALLDAGLFLRKSEVCCALPTTSQV